MKKLKKTKIFIFGKKSHNAEKKLKGGTLWDFSTSILSQNIKKKCRGDPLGKIFFRKKVSQCRKKNERGESLVSPGMVCYAEKQEKPFWFSSLDQIVHFDAIIFCRTFVELFWSVRVDRKKRVTIIVAFHFMKRRLKITLHAGMQHVKSSCSLLDITCTGYNVSWRIFQLQEGPFFRVLQFLRVNTKSFEAKGSLFGFCLVQIGFNANKML